MTRKKRRLWYDLYPNTSLLIVSLIVLYIVADTSAVHAFIDRLGSLGYLGVFIAGAFFVSIFTVGPAAIVLFHLAQELNPFMVALVAGAGGVVGDLIIFHFLRDRVFEELQKLFRPLKGYRFRFFCSPYFAWFSPVLGALIIASPLPDEVGIGLLGLSKIQWWQFVALTFILNSAGVLVVVLLTRLL